PVLRQELWQRKHGEVPQKEMQGNAAQAKSASAATPGQATGVDHVVVAYGNAIALELEVGAVGFERTPASDANAQGAILPEKHIVLRGCGLRGLRLLESHHRWRTRLFNARGRQCAATETPRPRPPAPKRCLWLAESGDAVHPA